MCSSAASPKTRSRHPGLSRHGGRCRRHAAAPQSLCIPRRVWIDRRRRICRSWTRKRDPSRGAARRRCVRRDRRTVRCRRRPPVRQRGHRLDHRPADRRFRNGPQARRMGARMGPAGTRAPRCLRHGRHLRHEERRDRHQYSVGRTAPSWFFNHPAPSVSTGTDATKRPWWRKLLGRP